MAIRSQAVSVRAEIGRRIAEARARAGGMTQEELGSRIGLSARGVQEIERDRSNPYRHVRAVAEHDGDVATAKSEFALTLKYWTAADPDLPELMEARKKAK